jgi:leucyl/phenylalanyl-tRNA--protein transferase
MIFKLSDRLAFPDPRNGEDDGLLAIGGDLSVDRLLLAYSYGIFPWYSFREGLIEWWCPMDRFVIFPQKIHVSHSMRTLLNKRRYTVTFDKAFKNVIHNCGQLRIEQEGAWLGPEMEEAYTRLHDQGFAKSVEVWETKDEHGTPVEPRLVGGLYGVTIGNCFIGESMFSLVPSASKIALIYLANLMDQLGGVMIDCQFETSHLKSMGGEHITYEEYMKYMKM